MNLLCIQDRDIDNTAQRVHGLSITIGIPSNNYVILMNTDES